MVHVVEAYQESGKIDDERTFVSVSDFHLAMDNNCYMGFTNFDELVRFLEKVNFDYLLMPGDCINDTSNLESAKFCNVLNRSIEDLTQGKLSFFTYGNHDFMRKENGNWVKEENSENRLANILGDLSNVIFLDELKSFCLNDDNLLKYGCYKRANVNIIGASLPFEFYEGENEDEMAFLKYWDRMKFVASKTWHSDSYNILMLHALKNFVQLSRDFDQLILPDIDLAVGGHYHNGSVPNWLNAVIPGNDGLVSPQMELWPKNVRGIIDVNGVPVHVGGYTNFRVESSFINKLLGGPYVFILHLLPLEKEEKKGVMRVKKYHV